jgi:tRNA-dihydrouridine synthase B
MRIGEKDLGRVFLAPLCGVTNSAFRRLCKEQGASMVYSQMVSADGLERGGEKTKALMRFEPDEHPFGIQLFGSEPESMGIAARIAAEGRPDLLDINFGCPVKKVVCRGKGAAVLKDPARAAAITKACVDAVDIPVTVKVRIGQDASTINIFDVVRALEDAGAAAVTIHGRTVAQMFSGSADWDLIAEVKRRAGIPIVGNGDIATADDAYRRLTEAGVDAVMIGRAALGNPFVFRQIREYLDTGRRPAPPSLRDRVEMAIRHAELQVEDLGERQGILTLRKQLAWYTKGMPESARLRERLFATERLDEVRRVLLEYVAQRTSGADVPAALAADSVGDPEALQEIA